MDEVKEVKEEVKEEDKIKCFVIAGGSNVIAEYRETIDPDGEGIDIYWINPMLADFTKLPTGQTALMMSPMFTFTKSDELGPINPYTIICAYDLEERIKNVYKEQVVKLRAARAGLVPGKMGPKNPRIGGDSKIQIAR